MDLFDPYFILRPRFQIKDCPKKVFPYLDTVRRVSEWVALGFSLKLDEHGYNIGKMEKTYWFRPAKESDPLVLEAINTGKKAENHPVVVFQYVQLGCKLSEFAVLPEDVKAFCEGKLLLARDEKEKALPLLEHAVELNPNEVNYLEIYYPLRMELGDLSGIEEEFTCFEHDIDAVIHIGRFEEWIKSLIIAKEYSRAKLLIEKVTVAINRLVSGEAKARFYAPQNSDWYASCRDKLRKNTGVFLTKINLAESKAAHSS